jgi:POT family proton-dependent oligopeptide transporter
MSFGLASIGLIIGMLTFLYGLRYISHPERLNHSIKALSKPLKLVAYTLLTIAGLSILIKLQKLTSILLPTMGVFLVLFMFYLAMQQSGQARSRMLVLNTLIISSVVYWMMYFQMFFSMNLFVDRLVNKEIFGIPLSTTVFYASESVFIILFGPLFATAWTRLSRRRANPSPYTKFTYGLAFAGLGMLVAAWGTLHPTGGMMIHPSYIFLAYFLITIGELMLSPIGLAAVTTLAPKNLTGLMMGIWFVAIGFGGIFAGFIAKIASIPDSVTLAADKIAIYQNAFIDFACMAFLMSITLVFLRQFGFKKIIQDSQ